VEEGNEKGEKGQHGHFFIGVRLEMGKNLKLRAHRRKRDLSKGEKKPKMNGFQKAAF